MKLSSDGHTWNSCALKIRRIGVSLSLAHSGTNRTSCTTVLGACGLSELNKTVRVEVMSHSSGVVFQSFTTHEMQSAEAHR